ncbi:unnamed protein product, partial [Brassica rapa]
MNTASRDTFEMGNKIQACCKRTHMYHVQHAIPVEKWGVIKNVQINAAGSRAD